MQYTKNMAALLKVLLCQIWRKNEQLFVEGMKNESILQ